MTTLLHLSDLHLSAPLTPSQTTVIELLFQAIERELASSPERARAVVITGDVFDTSSADRAAAAETLRDFCQGLRRATSGAGALLAPRTGPLAPSGTGTLPSSVTGPLAPSLTGSLAPSGDRAPAAAVPVLVLPGNHDRRRLGILGPEDTSLFRSLARAVGPDVRLFASGGPFLAELVPEALHGLPFHVVAYDSTMLSGGMISAGGLVRQEDLLQISAEIDALEAVSGGERKPLLLLVHHHLVPTPVTDLSHIELDRLPRSVRFVLDKGLRNLVAHGDREELTMTALGAGTALSTLCSLGRAVLVLHGHKHYPTARLLKGLRDHEGDILIGSAGSAGRVERWQPTELANGARVWPSFNRLWIDGANVTIESIGFSDRKPNRPFQRRTLAQAERRGARWELAPVPRGTDEHAVPLRTDDCVVTLVPNRSDKGATWDAHVDRALRWADPALLRPADDIVEGLPDGAVVFVKDGVEVRLPLPARVRIPPEGKLVYRIDRAACRTLAEGLRRYGNLAAHEWMGLLVRHASQRARLTLVNLPAGKKRPFGSATSLTSGEERAVPLRVTEEGLLLDLADCPPLTLLRIYWPLPE